MQKHESQRPGFYRPSKPPPDYQSAQDRLFEIGQIIERIEAQLAHASVDEWESEQEFFSWKDSALATLARFRNESNYLHAWLGRAVQTIEPKNTGDTKTYLIFVEAGAAKFKRDYSPLYAKENLPPTLAAAFERKRALAQVSREFISVFSTLALKGKELEVHESLLPILRRPMTIISEKLQEELRLIRHFLREQSGSVDYNSYLVGLVKRGIEAGMQLSPDEALKFEEICEWVENRNKAQPAP
jgi:hypothetical protein